MGLTKYNLSYKTHQQDAYGDIKHMLLNIDKPHMIPSNHTYSSNKERQHQQVNVSLPRKLAYVQEQTLGFFGFF